MVVTQDITKGGKGRGGEREEEGAIPGGYI